MSIKTCFSLFLTSEKQFMIYNYLISFRCKYTNSGFQKSQFLVSTQVIFNIDTYDHKTDYSRLTSTHHYN